MNTATAATAKEASMNALTHKQAAILELIIFFADDELRRPKIEKRAIELGLTPDDIDKWKKQFPFMKPFTEKAQNDYGDYDETAEDGDDEDNFDAEKKKKDDSYQYAVKDFKRIVGAARRGTLLFVSWRKEDPHHWRYVRFPPLDRPDVDKQRCDLLEEFAPRLFCTFIHNSVVNLGQRATQALLTKHLKGHHFSNGSFVPHFLGTDISIEEHYLMGAIHGDDDGYAAGNPGKWATDDVKELISKGDGSKLPTAAIRGDDRFKRISPLKKRGPSITEMEQKLSKNRLEAMLKYFIQNGIPHEERTSGIDATTIVDYLKSIEGLPVLLPPRLLDWKHIASNPHLFVSLDKLSQAYRQKIANDNDGKEAVTAADNEENIITAAAETLELLQNTTASFFNNNENSNNSRTTSTANKFTNNYEKIVNECLDDKSTAEALKTFLENDIMKMLHGEKDGLEYEAHLDYLYTCCNFLVGWLSHLTKDDRVDQYYNSTKNGNGRSIDVETVTAEYMKLVGVEALGAYNTPGHKYVHRIKYAAVPISQKMLIENGPVDAPISGSKVIVYADDYLPYPLEVNWMVVADDNIHSDEEEVLDLEL